MLIEPSWDDLLTLPERNATTLAGYDFEVAGGSFQQLRRSARAELLQLALQYSRRYCHVTEVDADRPLILTGHQPELFHPGVWAKNFAIDLIARRTSGVAIHVIIDNDLCRQHAIRVPTGTIDEPRAVSIPFDLYQRPLPFEARTVLDLDLIRSFPDRVQQSLGCFIARPLLHQLWPEVCSAVSSGKPLGHAIAQGRHVLERKWGCGSLEVPLSELCETDGFRRFLLHLLLHGDHATSTHNRLLAEYRQVHRLRSLAQPVPDLRVDLDGWVEAPFWMWTEADPERRPLWFRFRGADLEISDRHGPPLPLPSARLAPDDAVRRLRDLSASGLRIRPRALTNTMFARLFAGDLFMHGIGGAKYDQITDRWIAELFGVRPPEFATLSWTILLPIEHATVSIAEIRQARQELRDVFFHPERFLSPEDRQNPQVSAWIANKNVLISSQPPRGDRLARHLGIGEMNAKLRAILCKKTEKRARNLQHLLDLRRSCDLLESREFSFCLYPEEALRLPLLELDRLPG